MWPLETSLVLHRQWKGCLSYQCTTGQYGQGKRLATYTRDNLKKSVFCDSDYVTVYCKDEALVFENLVKNLTSIYKAGVPGLTGQLFLFAIPEILSRSSRTVMVMNMAGDQ